MTVGYVYDPIYLEHDTGDHVENASRLEAIVSMLETSGLDKRLKLIKPRPASEEEIALVHSKSHIAHIKELAESGGGNIGGETIVSPGSYKAALYAAGGVISAVDAVLNGDVNYAFALVRPPGHHAAAGEAMGFCLFNNVAVAAKYALQKPGVERIAIIDFDVHHGNGTQSAFYGNPSVLYVSTHESPLYPGTGAAEERGSGVGEGTNVNIPLPGGSGDAEYLRAFTEIIIPAVKRFNPDLMLVSAGYDPHWADGLAYMQVTVTGFARMVGIIKGLADELCGGKLVLALEGGYNLEALAWSVKATFDVLLGEKEIADPLGKPPRSYSPDVEPLMKAIKRVHGLV
jgi:acetoin utilization deacetylase AcuC-like enzyme